MWQRTSPGPSLSLFSSFLLHRLRSTRDPRRRTRLGWSRTHTHTPERGYMTPPIGSEKTGPILKRGHVASRSCGRHLTSATLPHNSSVALLFSSFLLHWLRSTRDPRRRTRLGWSRTHTHTPERSHTAQERERDTHTRTWRASLHSHSSSSPLHGGKRWAGPYRPCLASTRTRNCGSRPCLLASLGRDQAHRQIQRPQRCHLH